MKGILIVNMGGANSPKELKTFLANMFKDRHILPYGKFVRYFLSFIISNVRYKKSWKKYELIGNSPIIDATQKTMFSLQKKLGESYNVKMAFSYSSPLINESIRDFINEGIIDITVIPMYPQASISTTSSVEKDVYSAVSINNNVKINFVKEFYNQDGFILFWSKLISNHIKKNNYSNPYLIFSAHSIPKFLIEKGDTYPKAIEASALSIAKNLGLNFDFAYQSQMKRGEWIGPDINEVLKKTIDNEKNEIVIIPISFVNENLETLFDIDHEIIPNAKKELGIKNISRVEIPVADELFIELLINLIKTNNVK